MIDSERFRAIAIIAFSPLLMVVSDAGDGDTFSAT
jgi:hypothetical protein